MNTITNRIWVISGGVACGVGMLLLGGLAAWAAHAGHGAIAAILAGVGLATIAALGWMAALGALAVATIRRDVAGWRAGVTHIIDRLAAALRPRGDEETT